MNKSVNNKQQTVTARVSKENLPRMAAKLGELVITVTAVFILLIILQNNI